MRVFIPDSNVGPQFLVVFNLKRGEMPMLDQKKKFFEAKKGKKTAFQIANLKNAVDIDGSVADDSMANIVVFLTINYSNVIYKLRIYKMLDYV